MSHLPAFEDVGEQVAPARCNTSPPLIALTSSVVALLNMSVLEFEMDPFAPSASATRSWPL